MTNLANVFDANPKFNGPGEILESKEGFFSFIRPEGSQPFDTISELDKRVQVYEVARPENELSESSISHRERKNTLTLISEHYEELELGKTNKPVTIEVNRTA